MLFIKNIVKKNNFKSYTITFLIIIISLIIFNNLYKMLINNYNALVNKEIYRTIKVDGTVFIENDIEKIYYEDDYTYIVFNTYDELQSYIIDHEDLEYYVAAPEEENKIIYYSIKLLIVILYIVLIIILTMYTNCFINDDLDVIKMLKIIGYSEHNILIKYSLSFILIFTIIFLVASFLGNIIGILFFKTIDLMNLLVIYIILLLIILIVSTVKLAFTNKHNCTYIN